MRTELNAALAGEFAIGTDITISRLDLARCNNALAKKVMLRARLGLRSISSRAIYAGQRKLVQGFLAGVRPAIIF
jgi:hypothetical protein